MIQIRTLEGSDFSLLSAWWSEHGMPSPTRDIYPPTSYMCLYDGVPTLSASLFLMNCPGAAKIENLVGNPLLRAERKECVPLLFRHVERIAAAWGYKQLILFSYEDKLKQKYEDLGYVKTLENVTTFSKKIGD